jgi:hypothetical protein
MPPPDADGLLAETPNKQGLNAFQSRYLCPY